MLAGETPFASGPEDSPEDILQRIGKGQYDMSSGNWSTVSNLAKDIVTKMLDVNPTRRLTTGQILSHPWMTSRNQPTTNLLRQDSQHLKVLILFTILCMTGTLFFVSGSGECNLSGFAEPESSCANCWQHRPVRAGKKAKEVKAKERGIHINTSIARDDNQRQDGQKVKGNKYLRFT